MSVAAAPDEGNALKYNFCPRCRELWRADWMERAGVSACPACDAATIPIVSKRDRAIHPNRPLLSVVQPCILVAASG